MTSDGERIGTVRAVLEAARENIFDGIEIDTPGGPRWIDAPEVGRITEAQVTLTIDAAEAAALPEHDAKGAPEFDVNLGRKRFGRLWRRR